MVSEAVIFILLLPSIKRTAIVLVWSLTLAEGFPVFMVVITKVIYGVPDINLPVVPKVVGPRSDVGRLRLVFRHGNVHVAFIGVQVFVSQVLVFVVVH